MFKFIKFLALGTTVIVATLAAETLKAQSQPVGPPQTAYIKDLLPGDCFVTNKALKVYSKTTTPSGKHGYVSNNGQVLQSSNVYRIDSISRISSNSNPTGKKAVSLQVFEFGKTQMTGWIYGGLEDGKSDLVVVNCQ